MHRILARLAVSPSLAPATAAAVALLVGLACDRPNPGPAGAGSTASMSSTSAAPSPSTVASAASASAAPSASAAIAAASSASASSASSAPGAGAKIAAPQEAAEATTLGTMPKGTGLAVGSTVPDFTLIDAKTAESVSFEALRKRVGKPFFLVFYRGGWCPYCNFQVRGMNAQAAEFDKRGVGIVMISAETAQNQRALAASYSVTFPLMGDPEGKALEAFHVTHAMDAAELEKMKGYGIDVEAHAGNAKHIYATPSAFLIDASGKVRWGHVDPDASHRPTPKQLLSVLDKVKL